jgi:hypothetical protein
VPTISYLPIEKLIHHKTAIVEKSIIQYYSHFDEMMGQDALLSAIHDKD